MFVYRLEEYDDQGRPEMPSTNIITRFFVFSNFKPD
jgi:hypothetical protein